MIELLSKKLLDKMSILFLLFLISHVNACSNADRVTCAIAVANCGALCVGVYPACETCIPCAVCITAASAACCGCIFPDWKECSDQANICGHPGVDCCGMTPYNPQTSSCCGDKVYSPDTHMCCNNNIVSVGECCEIGLPGSRNYVQCPNDRCVQASIETFEIICCPHSRQYYGQPCY
jgi:hypothetical protein